jgi:6,7-dimethyl-8-ribityllumazine synthase
MAGHAPEIKIPKLPHLKAIVITAAWHPDICDALVAGAVRGFKDSGIASPVAVSYTHLTLPTKLL